MSMVQQLLADFEQHIEEMSLIPSGGGVFEVIAGDELVYSKKATGRHATYDDVAVPLRKLLDR